MTLDGSPTRRASTDETVSQAGVSPESLRLSWWRKRLFGLILRLDATSSPLEGVPADRIHSVDLPAKL